MMQAVNTRLYSVSVVETACRLVSRRLYDVNVVDAVLESLVQSEQLTLSTGSSSGLYFMTTFW